MEELIKVFHVDWKLLIAQAVNFCIVLATLWFFALKPVMRIMKEREDDIRHGLETAELMEKKMSQIEKDREAEVKKGRVEAQALIGKAEKQAEDARAEKIAKTQREVDKVIEQARQQIRAEREIMVRDVKAELGGLVSLALGKIAASSIDEKIHKKLIEDTIEELKTVEFEK